MGLYVSIRALALTVFVISAKTLGRDPYRILTAWDGQWYRGIAENGYGFVRRHPDGRSLSDYAFFPLFPLLERWFATALGISVVSAGLVISVLASVVAAAGIYALARRVAGPRTALFMPAMWGALPVSAVQWTAYSESLFTALAVWALHALLKRRWITAGCLAGLAGLTRPIGVAVVASVVVCALMYLWGHRRRRPHAASLRVLAAVLLAASGPASYLAFVAARKDSPLAYFELASAWGNGFDGGVTFISWVFDAMTSPPYVPGVLLVIAILGVAALYRACFVQQQPVALLVYTGVLLLLTASTSGYFGSRPRYLLPAIPLLLPVATWQSRGGKYGIASAVALVCCSTIYGAAWLLGDGPP